ncbi:enolase-phosphatase E1 [Anopheles bellator]|uniref:enolase-phosphatase E1 n=1 Tax=Anopheles bellator TaxID=139047 RepID=UPI0026499317|nr:enolase-phosphatase E1 [Anopheles bellator]
MAVVTLGEKILSAKSIICDIEGTTTSISFVKDVLFPYALKNTEEYLKTNWNEEATKTVVEALREQANEDKKANIEGVVTIATAGESDDLIIQDLVKNIEWQMSKDRKTGALKTLQGLVWAKGYKDGTIKGHVYEDVQQAFEQWDECGRKVYIYSSGSVDAQKLLFEHSEKGNLLKYLSGHYDTKIGAKQEKESYESILKNINAEAADVVFLTDVIAEAKAAKEAGVNVVLLDRPGNAELSEEDRKEFPVITTFSELSFKKINEENGSSATAKRKIDETTGVAEDNAQEPPNKQIKIDEVKTTENVTEPREKMEEEGAASVTTNVPENDNTKNEKDVESKCDENMEVDDAVVQKSCEEENEKDAIETKKDDKEASKSEKKEEILVDVTEKTTEMIEQNEKSEVLITMDAAESEKEKEKDGANDKQVESKDESKEINENSKIKQTSDEVDDQAKEKTRNEVNDVNEQIEDKVDSVEIEESNKNVQIEKVEETHGTETKTSGAIAEVDIGAKEVKEDMASSSTETPQNNGQVEQTVPKEDDGESNANQATRNGKTDDESNATTNGSSSENPTEEEKNSESDKENDTSLQNCEADEITNEKNGNNADTTTSIGEETTAVEGKNKKVAEAVTTSTAIEGEL